LSTSAEIGADGWVYGVVVTEGGGGSAPKAEEKSRLQSACDEGSYHKDKGHANNYKYIAARLYDYPVRNSV
jgi:hypothetical protein